MPSTKTSSWVIGSKFKGGYSFERFEIAVTKVFNILNDLESNSKKIFLSKGVHLVIDRSRLNLKQSLYFDIGDGRIAIERVAIENEEGGEKEGEG